MSAIANSNQPEAKPKTSRVQSYWRTIHWKKFASLLMAIALCFYLTACGDDNKATDRSVPDKKIETANIIEVSPPAEIQHLSRLLDRYEPQVSIISPKPEEVLNSDRVAVKFDVKNLPIFKNADFGLGPHIHVTLDNQEYQALYNLDQSTIFEGLSPGTHTLRAFASRPWHESFKNQGAYAQVSFHVLTKTSENTPDAKTPLLTYSRPVGTYGAEPILLDFYLQNAPLHLLAKEDEAIEDWQVRATVNGQSFTFDRWEPIYLKGFKQGKNWVKLELLEPDGDVIPNVFNSTAHIIDFQPNGTDTLARLVRGKKIANIEAIVNPDYVPPVPEAIATPAETVAPAAPATEQPEQTTPKTEIPSPEATKESVKEEAKSVDKAADKDAPKPVAAPAPAENKPSSEAIAPVQVKSAPAAPVKVKTAPLFVAPSKAIAPKISTDKATQVAPKTSSVKAVNSQEETKAIAPNNPKDYLKNVGFSSRRVFSTKSEPHKALEQPEVKVNEPIAEPKSDSKAPENSPAVIDLSATTSTPIKVLTNSGK
jgi:hypothetical protein